LAADLGLGVVPISRAMDDAPTSVPCSSWTGDTVTDTGRVVPSLRRRTVS
jgi:hypothetical protein